MTRRLRFLAVVLALAGMLFAQLAVAAYACPVLAAYLQSGSSSSLEDCCERATTDVEQPALCHAHCEPGTQAFEKPATALPLQGPASTPVAVLSAPHQVAIVLTPGEQRSLLVRPTAPPVALRHCCLRI